MYFEFVAVSLIIISIITIMFIKFFNRDPNRQCPRGSIIISPADGKVLYVKYFKPGQIPVPEKFGKKIELIELEGTNFFPSGGYLIGIYISLLDVHITRAPISGKMLDLFNKPGQFFSKNLFRLNTLDERRTCFIQNDLLTVAVVHLAAYLVRRIMFYIQPGMELHIGQKLGRIKFGSQVDIIISDLMGLSIVVEAGDKVRAGESVIAEIRE